MWNHVALNWTGGLRELGPNARGIGRTGALCSAMIVAFLFGVAGCTKVGPDFEPLTAPKSEQWIDEKDGRVKTDEADYTTWWQAFNDPVLNRLIEAAYRQNFDLQAAGLSVLEARAQLGIAIGDQYPQTQEFEGSLTRERLSDNEANAAALDGSYEDLSVGLDASWEIDFWGRFRRGIESADSALGSTIANYDDLLVTLTAEIAATYVQVREFEQRIRLVRRNTELQEQSFNLTRQRFRAGVVSELDVQQARALLEDTRSQVPQLETDQRQAENALGTLLGITPVEIRKMLAADAPIPTAPKEVAVGIPADLLRRRPDIREAELNAAAQSAKIGIAKADLFPRVSLAGFIGFQTAGSTDSRSNNAEVTDLFSTDSFTGSFGPSISLPFFNYGRITNNVRAQDARFQQLVADYQNTVLSAYQEVEDGLVGFLKAQEATEFLARSAKASERAVELSIIQYREGVSGYVRVLTALQDLLEHQDSLTQAQSSIATNLIASYRALGGGWQSRKVNDVVPDSVLEEMRERTDWGSIIPPDDLQDAPASAADVEKIDTLFRRPNF
jgi:NodT family efflux transporter outer membrane factor (OMF) lipoprotein